MKTKLIIVAGVFVALAASFAVSAQTIAEAPVKINPTTQKGVLNLKYAQATETPVTVKFFTDDRTIHSDKIAGDFPGGFQRKYDLRHVKADKFWVEISSANLTVTYKLIDSGDGSYTPQLEKTTYYHTLVAANN